MINCNEIPGVVDFLQHAAEAGWSGMLRARVSDEQVGVIVMYHGQVAWVVSRNQVEDFNSVLERVGLVSRDAFATVNHVLQNHRSLGKTAELGILLTEECMISPDLLRTCFKTHMSAAISSLVETPQLTFQAKEENLSVDTSLLFPLSELLPPIPETAGVELPEALEKGKLLTGLTNLAGYRYSFVADTAGNLLTYHMADCVDIQVERIIPKALDWLSTACKLSSETEMGLVLSAYLHGETGSQFAQMTDFSKQFFVAVSFSSAGKLGVIKHKISELIPEIRRFTEAQ
jgi:hypothetical protein